MRLYDECPSSAQFNSRVNNTIQRRNFGAIPNLGIQCAAVEDHLVETTLLESSQDRLPRPGPLPFMQDSESSR
jgi:hypothetical protein